MIDVDALESVPPVKDLVVTVRPFVHGRLTKQSMVKVRRLPKKPLPIDLLN